MVGLPPMVYPGYGTGKYLHVATAQQKTQHIDTNV